MEILIKNGVIVTHDEKDTVLKNGAIYITDEIIKAIGPSVELSGEYSGADKVIDANGRVVIPGFICGHMHFYSAFARGMPLRESPRGFLEILEKLWWKLDKTLYKEDVYYSALLGMIDAIKAGTTSIIDHHASPSFIKGSLDEIEKASRELGVRTNLCYEVTNRNGEEGAIEGLRENERFIKKCNSGDDLVTGLVGLHAAFTVSDSELDEASRIMKKNNSGVHVHVCEDKSDLADSLKKYNSTVVERLDSHGVLGPKTVLAHCVHVTDADYPLIKESKSNVIHNPRSNMNNAVGSLDIMKLEKHGIPFGLGTDGMSADMKDELIVANLIHKHVQNDNRIGTGMVYESLFKTNPVIMKKISGVDTGSIENGKKADVVLTNYVPPTRLTSGNVLGHVMFGLVNSQILTTIINGRICMENGKIPGINELEIAEKCEKLALEAWERLYQ
ncbi:MAG: putative aminohydrolase SsnA [Candidatus Hodarchaeales archaeon]